MRGSQNCSWLKVGVIGETCGKRCMGEFCKLHSYRMRGGSIIPKPCRKCGRATQSESQLCTSCGATVAKINMTRAEKKAHTVEISALLFGLSANNKKQVNSTRHYHYQAQAQQSNVSSTENSAFTSSYTKMKFGDLYILGAAGGNTSDNVAWDIFKIYGTLNTSLYYQDDVKCCLKYSVPLNKSNIAKNRPVKDHMFMQYMHLIESILRGFHFTCPNKRHTSGTVPVGIGLTVRGLSCSDRHVTYIKPYFPLKETGNKLAIGTKMAFGNVSAEWIIEWMETYKSLGVDKVLTYVLKQINQDALKVLEYYSSTDILELYYHEPSASAKLPRQFHPPTLQKFTDNHLVLTDSFERMSGYTYFGILDHDEFLIPSRGRSLKQLLADLYKSHQENTTGFVFKTQYFYLTWGPSDTVNNLLLGRYINRTKSSPEIDHQKSIYKPNYIALAGARTHLAVPITGYKMRTVQEEDAFIRHYRECRDKVYSQCSSAYERVRDYYMAKWSARIEENVLKVRESVFGT